MKIYIGHNRGFDFLKDLYAPLKDSKLAIDHEFIFPHERTQDAYPSKNLFTNKGCDLVVAETSFPSTGLGIELGWADAFGIKIVCLVKEGAKISGSLKAITKEILVYKDSVDLVNKLSNYLSK
jgi:hypothetical protein